MYIKCVYVAIYLKTFIYYSYGNNIHAESVYTITYDLRIYQ